MIADRAPRAKIAAIVTSPGLARQPWFDLDCGIIQHVVHVNEGEGAKTMASLEGLLDHLADLELSRDDVVVGVGGGAITDLAGFAAAVYLRGVAAVHVPTSVVGQVDAAIGGKTAVNIQAGKNLVGAFHQRAVFFRHPADEEAELTHCCETMRAQLGRTIVYADNVKTYGLKTSIVGTPALTIAHCPWCGSRLPPAA